MNNCLHNCTHFNPYYRYSCNEGMSWREFAFTNTRTALWGIVTEPGETTTQVLLVTFCCCTYQYANIYINFHV